MVAAAALAQAAPMLTQAAAQTKHSRKSSKSPNNKARNTNLSTRPFAAGRPMHRRGTFRSSYNPSFIWAQRVSSASASFVLLVAYPTAARSGEPDDVMATDA